MNFVKIGALGLGFALAALLELNSPASALTAFGVTYDLQATSPLNATTVSFDLHITGINGPSDTEGGRSAVHAFAFTKDGISFSSATPPAGFTFVNGGLNSSGCNGSGNFFCFTTPVVPPSSPALAANSTLDFLFSVTVASGTLATWTPDFKIDWVGSQNNYDLVSLPIAVRQVPAPVVGAGLPGLIAACAGLLALGRRRRQKIA
jgi:hypothetical protein